MIRALALTALLSCAAASAAAQGGAVMSGALIDALTAIERPELGGVFAYVGEANAPRAFADMLARDEDSMKKYAKKLDKDMDKSGGASAWDHEVCATLVNYFASGAPGVKVPKKKVLKVVNQTVLAPVKDLAEISAARSGK